LCDKKKAFTASWDTPTFAAIREFYIIIYNLYIIYIILYNLRCLSIISSHANPHFEVVFLISCTDTHSIVCFLKNLNYFLYVCLPIQFLSCQNCATYDPGAHLPVIYSQTSDEKCYNAAPFILTNVVFLFTIEK